MLVSLRKGGQGEILQQHIQPPGLGADRPGDVAVRTVQTQKIAAKKGEPKPSLSAKKSMTILVYQKTIFASRGRQKAMGLTEQEIIRLAAEQAAKVTMETLEGQRKKAKKERRDWRLRNTRLLLDHLQRFRDHATQSVFDVRKVLESAQNDPQGVYSQQLSSRQDVYLEGLAISAGRTEALVEQTESMLELYRLQCEKGNAEKQRRFRVLKAYALEGEDYQLIAEKESISKSTVFRDIDLATEELSVMLFGADIFYDMDGAGDGKKLGTKQERDMV